MRKNVKIVAVATVFLLTVGAFAIVYACSPNGSASATSELTDAQKLNQLQNMRPGLRLEAFKRFLARANATEIKGTVMTELKGMLILSTDDGQVTVLVPKIWTLDGQIVNRLELFNTTFYGQDVTLKVLKGEWQLSNFSINIMIAYEATSAEAQAYAVLPFNIVPNS
jgi:hypothetical protein